MNSLYLVVIGLAMIIGGYLIYAKFLGKKIFQLSDRYKTPAHAMNDGVDYVPTNKFVLWGHHFTSVAGAAPIVGPAVAIIWGWLPAFFWVTLGTIFIAGMHDMGILWASQRHRGQSIGTLSGRYIGKRGRNLFLVVIFLLLLMVVAAFAVVISNLLIANPSAVIPTWGAIVVALLIGQAVYRMQWNLPVVSILGVIALYALVLLGERFPIALPETVWGIPANGVWIILLFIYAAIASLLPVWILLQPRDYINGLQLFIALGILYGSMLLSAPSIVAPQLNSNVPEGTPSMWPLLFVTIACGAISGFHGMVSSGTSSKQLEKETDSRFVGYFGAAGEGLLALGTIIAVSAGFQSLAEWEEIYNAFNEGGISAFVDGGTNIVNAGLGIPVGISTTILATMAVLFAATTMDTGVRLQRLVVQEIAEVAGIRLKAFSATIIAVGIALVLTFSAGADGSGGMTLWPLFGTTNQIMAALSLSIIAIILAHLRRPSWLVVVPAIFVMVASLWAAISQLGTFISDGNWLLVLIDVVILVCAIWVVIEATAAYRRAQNTPKVVWTDEDTDAPLPQVQAIKRGK
ncbi:carbon starvation CstA family protein [Corynebacterium pseudodiphtheriticum]|uniref:carbon starvation CstA family protein n=1 Tax=Corynebacterium pseudodiphtheriticum TaxID=37637 RepID=UPI00047E71E3|nr:carbon starvation protein A [Corynebacterium pseudodiphtheriticum]